MENFRLKQLGQSVYNYCGLNYLNNLSSLEVKISKRLQELTFSLWEYIRFLEDNKGEWDRLIQILTINETYFYREDKQLTYFRDVILSKLKDVKREQPINIWSAACSTGEEPYSLAMLILDSGIVAPHQVKIMGTDIDKKVINTAMNGVYNKRSLAFRRIPEEWLGKYFDEGENEYKVKHTVREMVSFQHLNLLDDVGMSSQNGMDIIFCRNVLIYFDYETIRKVASSFFQLLNHGGYLFLGHAENISTMGIGFETVSAEGTFYYRKGNENGKNLWSVGR